MADFAPPSISVIESAAGDGVRRRPGERVKQSLESLLSRSDSGSGEEEVEEEAEQPRLAVPSSVQEKTRETSRKGRKISISAAFKVACVCVLCVCVQTLYTT